MAVRCQQVARNQTSRVGNDPYNLLAVNGPANQEKGSASAAYWLPTNSEYRCDYVARQIGVKDKYQLTVTSQEKDAMLAVLHTCPGPSRASGLGGRGYLEGLSSRGACPSSNARSSRRKRNVAK